MDPKIDIKNIKKQVEAGVKDVKILERYANYLFTSEEYQQAEKEYLKLLEMNHKNEKVYLCLGITSKHLNNFSDAEMYFRKSIQAKENLLAYFYLGDLFDIIGKRSESIKNFHKVLNLNKDYEEAYFRLGLLFRKVNIEQAQEYFSKAIEIDPKYAEAYTELGGILFSKGNYNEALDKLNKSLSLNSKLGWTHVYLVETFFHLKNINKAIEHYQQLEDIFEDNYQDIKELIIKHCGKKFVNQASRK